MRGSLEAWLHEPVRTPCVIQGIAGGSGAAGGRRVREEGGACGTGDASATGRPPGSRFRPRRREDRARATAAACAYCIAMNTRRTLCPIRFPAGAPPMLRMTRFTPR